MITEESDDFDDGTLEAFSTDGEKDDAKEEDCDCDGFSAGDKNCNALVLGFRYAGTIVNVVYLSKTV